MHCFTRSGRTPWILFWFAILGFSGKAWAFPENIRHGYANCISCHVNPNGQGLLNDYGRQVSKALQSYGKFFFEPSTAKPPADTPAPDVDPEPEFLYGALKLPSWLNLGGDFRFLQLFTNTPVVEPAQFYVMQMDVEGAVTFGKLTIDATIGRDDPTYYGNFQPGFTDYILSRRHYVLFQATDELFFMGGRFWKPYGILDPNHSSTVKESIGWNYDTESYNLESGYLGETLDLLAYYSFGRPDNTYFNIEKGPGLTASAGFANTYRAGLSYFYGYTDTTRRQVFGPWALLGFTPRFYLRTENDFIDSFAPGQPRTFGMSTYNRLGYELVQGFHAYLEQGFYRPDFTVVDISQLQTYGVGVLYYPRPHWEFEADYQKRKFGVEPATLGFTDYVYLQMHYYL